ncbi:MAG: hypothetical protein NTZ27_08675 [Ignavibacteriales bacterium]|nr:hypothetical protein [Ignavibacteriales bacterium]
MIPYTKTIAITEIQSQISVIDSINPSELFSEQFEDWRKKTEGLLSDIFNSDSRQLKDFIKLKFRPSIRFLSTVVNDQTDVKYFKDGLNTAKILLESFIKEIDKYWQDDIKANNKSNINLNDVIELKPNFMGFGLNINAIIKKFFKRKQN